MFNQPIVKTGRIIGITLATLTLSLPGHAYDYGGSYGGYDNRSGGGMGMGSGSGSGSGMGMGSGSGYYDRRGYGYDYQRPPRPPLRPGRFQREPMRPYGGYQYQRPPREPMRPYGGYRQAPMTPPAATTPAAPAAEAAAGNINIAIQGMAYQPATMTVKAGSTVTWTNNDSAPHTVTSSDGGPLASGTLNRGNSYSITLDQPGTYNYICKFHPRMRATIVVQ